MDEREEVIGINIRESDLAQLEGGAGAALDRIDREGVTGQIGEKGVTEEEEPRMRYETKVTLLKLLGGLTSLGFFGAALYILSGRFIREPISAEWRVEDKALGYVWLFDRKDPLFKGGVQILNVLEQSRSPEVNYNERETWGYRQLPGGILEGGNNFGEKARMLVQWTELLLSPSGREGLIGKAKKTHLGEEGAVEFDQRMRSEELTVGRSLTWAETRVILQEEFGFEGHYLNILTELRNEYFTGDGNLQKAIEEAKMVGKQERLIAQEKAQLGLARKLLQATRLDQTVDAETAVAIATSFPYDTTEVRATTAVQETFLSLPSVPPIRGVESTPLMMAITLGYLAREGAPLLSRWAKEKLVGFGEKVPRIRAFLSKEER